jgi:hypothetical protein
MWGNRLGWGISLLIVLAYAGMVVWVEREARVVTPTTELAQRAGVTGSLDLPVPADAVVPAMADACDAGPLYAEAIALYRADPRRYDDFRKPGAPGGADVADLEAVAKLVEATRCAGMSLFAGRPESVVRYGSVDDLLALQALGDLTAVRLGLNYKLAGQRAEAARYFEATFALGHKLFGERLTYDEAAVGLDLMGKGAAGLLDLARQSGDAGRAAEIERFEAARRALVSDRIQPILRVVRSIDGTIVARHAGDVFHFARSAEERMWRVEAILALGRMRFFVGTSGRAGDQRQAAEQLRLYVDDPDPAVRAAARAALELTLEEYRMLR